MTRRDHAIVGGLVLLLAMIATAIAAPAAFPAASTPDPTASWTARPYREGVIGHPGSVSPLSARTQVDRDLVALVFSGLVRLGPDGTIVPDLATTWRVDDDGRTWTFRIRDDAHWHDGESVTAEDVVFTIRTMQHPEYTGPGAASWSETTVRAVGTHDVRFELATPLAGFLLAATQAIAPAHLLADVPVAQLADDPFGRQPVGSGPFAVTFLDETRATLVAASALPPVSSSPDADAAASPANGPANGPAANELLTQIPGIEFRFFDDPGALADIYRSGQLDAVTGLEPAAAVALADRDGSRLLHYPGSTLTAVAFNLRQAQPLFREPGVRRALLAAIDRAAVVEEVYAGAAARADSLVPPASWAFDLAAAVPVAHDPAAAASGLEAAGWKREDGGWSAPGTTAPLEVELISPDAATNPGTFAAAQAIARDWGRLGLKVTHVGLPRAEFVGERLRTGEFQAAVLDLNIGLDPDLYPLLASTQATSQGSNISGIQDGELDALLVAARKPGTEEERRAAFTALQTRLAARDYLLPLVFRDVLVVASDRVVGPSTRQVGDPRDRFWDVLTWRLAVDR